MARPSTNVGHLWGVDVNDDEIRKVVTGKKGGPIEEIHGPYRLNGFDVWQVWSKPGGSYETRYVVAKAGSEPEYRDTFGSLALEMEKEHGKGKLLPNLMAATGFMVGLGLLAYFVIWDRRVDGAAFALVASLVASAGAYYYGAWKAS
jgi:hypothetical protein